MPLFLAIRIVAALDFVVGVAILAAVGADPLCTVAL
jgi:hypothetical protein